MSDAFSPDLLIYLTSNLGISQIYNIVLSELIIIDLMDICITSHSSPIFLFDLSCLKSPSFSFQVSNEA